MDVDANLVVCSGRPHARSACRCESGEENSDKYTVKCVYIYYSVLGDTGCRPLLDLRPRFAN